MWFLSNAQWFRIVENFRKSTEPLARPPAFLLDSTEIFLPKKSTAKLAKNVNFFLAPKEIIIWAFERSAKSPSSLGALVWETLFLDDPFSPLYQPLIPL